MRIGTNWSTGNAVTHSLSPSPSPSVLPKSGRSGQEVDLQPGPSSRRIVTSRLSEAISPTLERRSIVAPAGNLPYPAHPPGFPFPPITHSDAEISYHPRLGPLRTRIPRAPPRPRLESHPQTDVPKHLLCLAGNFVLVAYPNSPLLHVHDSRPLRSDLGAEFSQQQDPDSDNPLVAELSRSTDSNAPFTMNRPIALVPPPPGWSSPSRPDLITSMAVDESDESEVRLVLFYRSGGFVILTLHRPELVPDQDTDPGRIWTREVVHVPAEIRKSRKRHYIPPPAERVVLAGIRGRLVVGITGRFYISIFEVTGGAGQGGMDDGGPSSVKLLKVIHSAVASWPASLSLDTGGQNELDPDQEDREDGSSEKTSKKGTTCIIRLGYCSPIYPRSWKPSIQDIHVHLAPERAASTTAMVNEPQIVLSDPIELVRQSSPNKQYRDTYVGVKTRPGAPARVMALSSGWIVLAGKDDLVEIYRIHPPRPDLRSVHDPQPGLGRNIRAFEEGHSSGYVIEHSQTLLGHGAGIRSIALRNGRCVTSGEDGRVLVWRLDRGADFRPPEEEDEARDAGGDIDGRDETMGMVWDGRKGVVEIREGTRRPRERVKGDSAEPDVDMGKDGWKRGILPVPPVTHPLSLVSAARELLLSSPTSPGSENAKVKDLAFNEDTIVGLMLDEKDSASQGTSENELGVVRVWKFDA